MIEAIGYAAKSKRSSLKSYAFNRKNLAANEVLIDIKYCGVCHSDVHQVRNDWHNTLYPCMPGHEIIGVIEKAGRGVRKFKTGDVVGVGCMIGSCKKCESCRAGLEQFCEQGATATYNGNMSEPQPGENTYGGYSNKIVVRQDFVLRIPDSIAPEAAGPILCAGITTYSPLRYWKVKRGTKVGVIGVGGLGHMAIKLAKAMGAEVTAITHSKQKLADARAIGAKHTLLSTDKKAMKAGEKSLDFILSTIPDAYDPNPYMELLRRDGVLANVGCLVPLKKPLDMSKMLMERRSFATSLIGGIRETQEVLDFCAEHGIAPDTKLIPIQDINSAFDHLEKGDVDFRYVIDMSTLAKEKPSKGLLGALGIKTAEQRKAH